MVIFSIKIGTLRRNLEIRQIPSLQKQSEKRKSELKIGWRRLSTDTDHKVVIANVFLDDSRIVIGKTKAKP